MIPYVLSASEEEEALARGIADVGALQVARVYAEALLNAAEQAGQADEVIEDFEALQRALEVPRSELRRFFASGVISRDTRAEVIRKAFEGRANPLLVNFLLVVNEHERTTLLPAILFELVHLRDERKKRLPVTVQAAVQLTDEQIETVARAVREGLKLEPVIEVKIDPELLGGILLRVGDWVFDGTVRTRLNDLRNQIIARSSYEIQSGRDRFSTSG
jgi:F-type H+-transporting ATPase subunit delta